MSVAHKPLSLDEARSQLWKAVADNKAVHAANLLSSHPGLADGKLPKEAIPEDGTAPLGWYARALAQLPLLNRPQEAQALYARALDTLAVLRRFDVPFQGVAEFSDSLVTKKLIATPSSPYGAWFLEQGLLEHQQLLGVVLPEVPAPRRRKPGF